MQILLDHLTALLVGSMIMLSIVVMNHRNVQANVETYSFYDAKVRADALMQTIKGDLPNISQIDVVRTTPTNDRLEELIFVGNVDSTDAALEEVRYRVTENTDECITGKGSEASPDTVPCYTFSRSWRTPGTGSWSEEAEFSPLAEATLILRDQNGHEAAALEDAEFLDLAISIYSARQQPGQMTWRTSWRSTFSPELLKSP